jgi:hydrogenase maturation protease
MNDLYLKIKSYLETKFLIVGLGNILRADDAVGLILARRLKKKTKFSIFDVETAFENYLEKIIQKKPKTLFIIDAIDFGGKPGEVKLFSPGELSTLNLGFTHNPSLNLGINYLQNKLKINIIILAIQPKSIVFKRGLSSEIKKTVDLLENLFILCQR